MVHSNSAYNNKKCRCCQCREFHALTKYLASRRLAKETPFDRIPHGVNGYTNYLCRCDICREAQNAWQRDYRARRKAAVV